MRILTVLLCMSLVSCKGMIESYSRSNSGVSALDKKILADFRQSQIVGGPSPSACPTAPPGCKEALSHEQGSFTYAAENEQACLYRCADTNKLQVWSGGKLQVSSDTPYSSILKIFDLNHDDQNEMLLSVETTTAAVRDREASLVDYEKNTLHPVEDFGTVYHNPCEVFAGADESKKKKLIARGNSPFLEALVIYYLPRPGNQMPSFTVERYRAPCPAVPNAAPVSWERVGVR